jgi:hypothetical protein
MWDVVCLHFVYVYTMRTNMVFSCMKKDIKGQIMSRNDTIGSLMTSSRGSIALGEVTRGHVEGEFQARTEKEQSGLARNTL